MSVTLRLAKLEDQQRCSELLNVLAKATADPHEIFDSDTFEHLISNERGSLVIAEENGKIPQKLYRRILDASSFKLNWVLDPFMGTGDVGLASKQSGRRFIGFETNKDHLLLAMKRIDKDQS